MEYNFRKIEKYWQQKWKEDGSYKVETNLLKPKYYVLDMFPYPSGAGLHVGHPLGYIASDIIARFKRIRGFNVLHPMGYDSFGLPAEQFALETGQHPAVTTAKNIDTFRKQLDNIGFSYDWSRELRTSDPAYYKWTQWLFLKIFSSWFDRRLNKARPIEELIGIFEKDGNRLLIHDNETLVFSGVEWKAFDEDKRHEVLMRYRLAYVADGEVNWCEGLGTVLANDEVVNGVSERGGFPVIKKKMRQWYLRITEYAERLLSGLDRVEFSDSMKEMQRNWIGKSEGAELSFKLVEDDEDNLIKVYTTRPDTIFGVDFMVLAPEHELVSKITTHAQSEKIAGYLEYVGSRSERERMSEVKLITGCFTGAFAINPFDGRKIPVWISEYVLAGYGTGAIMAVPCGDQRDFNFAKHFDIPITNIIGKFFNDTEANSTKEAILENSGFINGMVMKDAIPVVNKKIEELCIGKPKVNYKMRDAGFSRQRYWGEPFPIVYKNGIAYAINDPSTGLDPKEQQLPVVLPHVDSYTPGPEGQGPLANLPGWVNTTGLQRETNTMPGYAGSSWYFLRYADPHNNEEFASRQAVDYWNQVDVYIGGTEHAVGHLLYSRMWTKIFYDLGMIGFDEPFKKLVNQGMIQGSSRFVYRVRGMNKFISAGLKAEFETDELYVDVNFCDGLVLDLDQFRKWKSEFHDAEFILEDGKYICGMVTEKMSKRLYNTVNPDVIVEKYGADTFRMYEMFLGPVEQSKPWETKGIEGVHRFTRKLWRLFFDDVKGKAWVVEAANQAELKVLHRTIKKITEDTERFSFNTAVSTFMVCVNELGELKCNKKEILESLLILLAPYAPHIAEELWHELGNKESILDAPYPQFNEAFIIESSKEYPVSVNGKLRTTINISLDASQAEVEKLAVENEVIQKWLDGKSPKKIIFVKGKMVNVVV